MKHREEYKKKPHTMAMRRRSMKAKKAAKKGMKKAMKAMRKKK